MTKEIAKLIYERINVDQGLKKIIDEFQKELEEHYVEKYKDIKELQPAFIETEDAYRIEYLAPVAKTLIKIQMDMDKQVGDVTCTLCFEGFVIPKDPEGKMKIKRLVAKINTDEIVKAKFIENEKEEQIVLQILNKGTANGVFSLERVELYLKEERILRHVAAKYIDQLMCGM